MNVESFSVSDRQKKSPPPDPDSLAKLADGVERLEGFAGALAALAPDPAPDPGHAAALEEARARIAAEADKTQKLPAAPPRFHTGNFVRRAQEDLFQAPPIFRISRVFPRASDLGSGGFGRAREILGEDFDDAEPWYLMVSGQLLPERFLADF